MTRRKRYSVFNTRLMQRTEGGGLALFLISLENGQEIASIKGKEYQVLKNRNDLDENDLYRILLNRVNSESSKFESLLTKEDRVWLRERNHIKIT